MVLFEGTIARSSKVAAFGSMNTPGQESYRCHPVSPVLDGAALNTYVFKVNTQLGNELSRGCFGWPANKMTFNGWFDLTPSAKRFSPISNKKVHLWKRDCSLMRSSAASVATDTPLLRTGAVPTFHWRIQEIPQDTHLL